jgi:hypothetical protein
LDDPLMRPEMHPSRFNFQPDIVGTPFGAIGCAGFCCPRGGAGTEAGSGSFPPSPNREMVGLLVNGATVSVARFDSTCLSRFAFSVASFCRARASALAAEAAVFAACASLSLAALSSASFFAAAAFSAAALSRAAADAAAASARAFAAAFASSGALKVALPPTK